MSDCASLQTHGATAGHGVTNAVSLRCLHGIKLCRRNGISHRKKAPTMCACTMGRHSSCWATQLERSFVLRMRMCILTAGTYWQNSCIQLGSSRELVVSLVVRQARQTMIENS